MGEVIRFPEESISRRERSAGAEAQPATVVILPVVRIERAEEPTNVEPQAGTSSGKRRRRRASR